MDVDLKDKFESSFGREPNLPPVQDAVLGGRRAVARRRVSLGAGALVLAAIAAVAVGQAGGAPRSGPGPSGHPSPTSTATSQPMSAAERHEQRLTNALPVDTSWQESCGHAGQPTCSSRELYVPLVGLDGTSALVRRSDEVVVLKRRDLGVDTGQPVTVLEARDDVNGPFWYVIALGPHGRFVIRSADPGYSEIDFYAFARGIATGHPEKGAPPLVRERLARY